MASYKYTKGISLAELANMDPSKLLNLPLPALREATRRLADAANKRVKRAGTSNVSPAIRQAKRGGKFSTRGKDIVSLRNEFRRASEFLQAPTSTSKGWEKAQEQLFQKMQDAGYNVRPDQMGQMLDLFDKIKEADSSAGTKGEKYKYLRELTEMVEEPETDKDREMSSAETVQRGRDIIDALERALEEFGYGEPGGDSSGVSAFFESL